MTFAISIGKWGGFYWRRDYTTRLCLGWVAFTFYPFDMDDLHNRHRETIKTMAGMMDDQSRRLAELDELRASATLATDRCKALEAQKRALLARIAQLEQTQR